MSESVRVEVGSIDHNAGMSDKEEHPSELGNISDLLGQQSEDTPHGQLPSLGTNEHHLDDSKTVSVPLLNYFKKYEGVEESPEFAKKELSHIAHLNGLRALAFLGVLIFHFKHGCQGGFLGVDIFFVLSGFLMTRSIRSQIEKGTFRYTHFIVRRFWRLYPALLCTIFGTLVLSYLFFSNELVAQIARSAEASVFALSNVLFKSEEGYFGTESSLKPLLHTWSLSVEWQFYIFWPFFMLALHYCNAFSVWPFVILSAISFVYGWYTAIVNPQGAFFLLPGRVFEFGLGSIALISAPTVTSDISANLVSIAGTALIVASFLFLNPSIAVPAVIAVPALFGALLIIVSPSGAVANRIYTNPIMDYLGKISYSAYLVHWPVYVFFNNIYEHTGPPWKVEATVVTVLLFVSAAMHRHVEDPMRTGKERRHKIIGLGMVVVTLFVSRHALSTSGWKGRYTTPRAGLAKAYPSTVYAKELNDLYNPTLNIIPGTNTELTYGIVPQSANLSVSRGDTFDGIIVGDSFAAPFAGAMDSIAKENGKSFVVTSHFSCAPFFDNTSMDPTIRDYPKNSKRGKECKESIRQRVLDLIKGTKTKTVFLAGNWLATSQMWRAVHTRDEQKGTSDDAGKDVKPSQIEETVSLLHDLGKKVVLIGMIPGVHYNSRACLSSSGLFAFLKNCPSRTRYEEPVSGADDMKTKIRGRNTIRSTFEELFKQSEVFKKGTSERWLSFVDPFKSLCDADRGDCAAIHEGELVYSDDHHLSANGTRILKDDLYSAWKFVNPETHKEKSGEALRDLIRSVIKDISALGNYTRAAI